MHHQSSLTQPHSIAHCLRRQAGAAVSHALAASVVLAEDIPVLRVFEASSSSADPYALHARAYRLDTVEDDEAMTSSLPLPNARGASGVLPPVSGR